jgi:hypothetical protein
MGMALMGPEVPSLVLSVTQQEAFLSPSVSTLSNSQSYVFGVIILERDDTERCSIRLFLLTRLESGVFGMAFKQLLPRGASMQLHIGFSTVYLAGCSPCLCMGSSLPQMEQP